MYISEMLQRADLSALVESRNDAEIAKALSVGRVTLGPMKIGIEHVLEALGVEAGGKFLTSLSSAPNWSFLYITLELGRFNIGSPWGQQVISDMETAGFLRTEEACVLKGLANVPDPVLLYEVSQELNQRAEEEKLSHG